MIDTGCAAFADRSGADETVVIIQNESLSAKVLVDRGATIHELTHRPTGIDLLWKTPWSGRYAGALLGSQSSRVNWLDNFAGGWPVMFPNGGDACNHHGAE